MRRLFAWILGKGSGAAVSQKRSDEINSESGKLRKEAREVIERRRRLKEEERSLVRVRR